MRSGLLVLAVLVGVGCSTAGSEGPREPFSLGGGGAREPFNPDEYAARFRHPLECEGMARQLQARSRDEAWSVLQACVRTGNFWPLRALLTPAWLPDLRFRPDAANLLASVVASRGGEVQSDLELLHAYKLPLFSLQDGLENPELYAGRLVLVRARVEELHKQDGKLVAALAERTLESERQPPRQLGPSEVVEEDGQDTYWNPREGNQRSGSSHTEHRLEEPRWENVSVDTGRLALAAVPEPDPFLEPGQEFLFLARFDGLEPADSPKDAPVARLTLIHFEKPAGLVLY